MKQEWAEIEFDVKAYKETGTSIVGGIDEIIALLDDHIVKTQTMCGSMYIKAIEGEARGWESQLKYAQNLVDEWIAMQRVWMYLEPIFGSEDIMRQLPTEARRFNDVDKLWRSTMKATEEDPVFISQAEPSKQLVKKMQDANEKLDKIQKGLSDYLEMKRLYFPRFFFLADEQMLEILSQSKEPRAVQPHLGKCFEGLNTIKF
jgi:dynein heavy chain